MADMPLYIGDSAIWRFAAPEDRHDGGHRPVSRPNFLVYCHWPDGGLPSCRHAVELPHGKTASASLSSDHRFCGRTCGPLRRANSHSPSGSARSHPQDRPHLYSSGRNEDEVGLADGCERCLRANVNWPVAADRTSVHRSGGHSKARHLPFSREEVPQRAGMTEDLHRANGSRRESLVEKQDGDLHHVYPPGGEAPNGLITYVQWHIRHPDFNLIRRLILGIANYL